MATTAAVALAAPAFAQSDAASQPGASAQPAAGGPVQDVPTPEAGIQDIVVTAQKRNESLQKVPVAVTAVSGATLQEQNITQFVDLAKVSPSLNLTVGSQPTNSTIVLRGIGTLAFGTGVEPSVSVIVDDLPALNQAQAFSNLSDLERIEVLRGPQGTLFGKSASAGLVNIVSRAPERTFGGSANVSATNDGQTQADVAVTGPLGERVAARLNVFWQHNDGYVRNLNSGNRLGYNRGWGARLRVAADLTDTLALDLSARYTRDRGAPFQTFAAVPATGTIFNVRVTTNLDGIQPGIGNDRVRYTFDQRTKNTVGAVSGKLSLDLGPASLISVTGYQKWNYNSFIDADNMAVPVLNSPQGVYNYGPFESKLLTEELRLVSSGQTALQYLAGLFYADGRSQRTFQRFPIGSAQANDWSARNGTRTYAAFAQVTYNVTDTTHLDAGGRVNREEIDVTFTDRLLPVPAPASNCLATCRGDSDDTAFTYKLSVRQDLTPTVMAYAAYATGYKGQAYDINSGFNQNKAANPVRPETSKSGELGLKSRLFDSRLVLNVAAYRATYANFQAQSQIVQPNGTNSFVLSNVGRLRTQGVEVEATARPVRPLTINATAAYTDTEILSFPNAQCYPGQTAALGCVGGVQNLTGRSSPNAPKFRYTVGARLEGLVSRNFIGFVEGNYRHQSTTSYDLLGNPVAVQAPYGVFDLNVGASPEGKAFTIAFFVKNLFDKAYAATVVAPTGGSGGVAVQTLMRDYKRYGGIRAAVTF